MPRNSGLLEAVELPILRTSERGAFGRCWQKWWYEYRLGLRPRGKQADARWFGIGVHEALAEWYQPGRKRGRHPARTFEEWADGEIAWVKTWLGDDYDEAVWVDAVELGISMLTEYVNHWGRDDQWDVIAIEEPFKVRIKRGGEPVALFASRWDGVIRDRRTKLVLLLENKTASQINTVYLEGDNQAGAYLAVANNFLRARGVLKPSENIGGIQYNFLRKALPDDRPQDADGVRHNKATKNHYVSQLTGVDGWTEDKLRKMKIDELDSIAAANFVVVLGDVSLKQPPPLFVRPEPITKTPAEIKTQLIRIADEVSVMNLVRNGDLPVIKSRTRDCPWCDFWDICLLSDRGDDRWKTIMNAAYSVFDPYTDIREGNPIKSAGE
jgi:hypothetical protein